MQLATCNYWYCNKYILKAAWTHFITIIMKFVLILIYQKWSDMISTVEVNAITLNFGSDTCQIKVGVVIPTPFNLH